VKIFLPKPYTAEKPLKTVAAALKEEWRNGALRFQPIAPAAVPSSFFKR
jgi:hypothetical protein